MSDTNQTTITAEPRESGDDDPEPPGRLQIDIFTEDGDWSVFEPVEEAIGAVADVVARRFDLEDAEAAVALSSDERIRALNLAYRGKDKPTNVLSFPSGNVSVPAGSRRLLGDLILAAETVAREAAAEGKPPRHHLQHLVLHGLLHLLGYDHETEPEALEMEALEVELLAELGVPDPYGAHPATEA